MSSRSLLRLTVVLFAVAIASAETSQTRQPYARQPRPKVDSHSTHRQYPTPSSTYLESAEALRQGEATEALRLLEPLAEGSLPSADTARLVQGLQANRADMPQTAIRYLESVRSHDHLDDWRLYALADSARELDNYPTVEQALSQLLTLHPDSPIRAHAVVLGAEAAVESNNFDSAMEWVDRARRDGLALDQAEEIERLAWKIAEETGQVDFQKLTARRLLTRHPLAADELDALEVFGQEGDRATLVEVLTPSELHVRARRLLDDDQASQAIESLELIPDDDRDLDWTLLYSESLTEDRKGADAYRQLRTLQTADATTEAKIAWQRALAALDASRVRKGRRNLNQSERQEMQRVALDQLRRIDELEVDADTSKRALKLLFAELSEDDNFEQAMSVLMRLLEVDPTDTTGRRYLWRLGWQAYIARDYPVAIGYWSELESMYPETTNARSGRYWTGRSHQALGHSNRANEIFAEIVAPGIEDFYSRHAAARLSPDFVASTRAPRNPTEPWPGDPLLERALWLSDLGLDEFALIELDTLRERTDSRAQWAAEAIVLARNGQRRDSIRKLARAFPALGRPNQAIVPSDALRLYYPLDFRDIIERYAKEKDLSPYLVFAMVRQESAFDVTAKSWAGARGLMQLMPATGRELAQRMGLRYSSDRLNDPEFSVRLGTSYYSQVLNMFDGNHELALAGYNGGPYRIKKLWRQAGSNPELDTFLENLGLEETKTYVKRILLFENSYRRLYSQPS